MRRFQSRAPVMPSRRTRGLLLLLASTFLVLAGPRTADAQLIESADVYAKIVNPITIQKLADLDYGIIAAGGGGGTMRIRPDGTHTFTGDVVSQGGDPHPAEFEVSGYAGLVYNVSMPSSIELADSGGNSMTVARFTSSNNGSGTLLGGLDTFTVGATLRVSPSQAPGEYTGTFDVTVAYQ